MNEHFLKHYAWSLALTAECVFESDNILLVSSIVLTIDCHRRNIYLTITDNFVQDDQSFDQFDLISNIKRYLQLIEVTF